MFLIFKEKLISNITGIISAFQCIILFIKGESFASITLILNLLPTMIIHKSPLIYHRLISRGLFPQPHPVHLYETCLIAPSRGECFLKKEQKSPLFVWKMLKKTRQRLWESMTLRETCSSGEPFQKSLQELIDGSSRRSY